MQETERLYFHDSFLLEFSATIVAASQRAATHRVILDRTAFYPTGGGQPHDTGLLGDGKVIEVIEDDAGVISHFVVGGGGFRIGQTVTGSVDRTRRIDHVQQHSGQHILSQAFLRACRAQTRSFHLGDETSTIDIELESAAAEHIRAAEDIANDAVFGDRLMSIHLVSEDEALRLPLRKESGLGGRVRLIEIDEFDLSPCGGTHASRTGQVGLIAIKSYERARGLTRVEFVCGSRALADYRRANNTASSIARLFSAHRESAAELAAALIDENKALKKRERTLIESAAFFEGSHLLAGAEACGGFKIVSAVFDGRSQEEIRALASRVVTQEPAVALLATRVADSARVVFARSAGIPVDMTRLFQESCVVHGGKGGGKPDLVQGGFTDGSRVEEAMSEAALNLKSQVR